MGCGLLVLVTFGSSTTIDPGWNVISHQGQKINLRILWPTWTPRLEDEIWKVTKTTKTLRFPRWLVFRTLWLCDSLELQRLLSLTVTYDELEGHREREREKKTRNLASPVLSFWRGCCSITSFPKCLMGSGYCPASQRSTLGISEQPQEPCNRKVLLNGLPVCLVSPDLQIIVLKWSCNHGSLENCLILIANLEHWDHPRAHIDNSTKESLKDSIPNKDYSSNQNSGGYAQREHESRPPQLASFLPNFKIISQWLS